MPARIILDTDAGVDDILALFLLLRSPDLAEVLGVTLVAGNTTLPQCIANVRRALNVAALYRDGRTMPLTFPIAVGAADSLSPTGVDALDVHGFDGLGGTSAMRDTAGNLLYPEAEVVFDQRPAADFILDSARRHPGEVTVVAIGPLTNLALALRHDPDGFRKLRSIVLMGGAFRHDGNVTPAAEFNIFWDAVAASEVLQSGVPLTIVPLDCSEQTWLRPADLEGEGPVHAFLRDATRFILRFHQQYEGFEGCYHHDPVAVGVALDPSLATGVHVRVDVETEGRITRGATVACLRPHRPLNGDPPNAFVCLQPEKERFERFFADRVLPPGA
jgi:purine nucleosidase/pyrimidine-specific ribonucleoside hydrolase